MKSKLLVLSLFTLVFAAGSTAQAQEPLRQIAAGTWDTNIAGDGITSRADVNVWVDISVPDLSTSKWVGIVWTEDNWQTVRWAYGQKEADLGNGNERWGVDLTPAGTIREHRSIGPLEWTNPEGQTRSVRGQSVVVEYAIFYQHPSGTMYWDNNNNQNYRITLAD